MERKQELAQAAGARLTSVQDFHEWQGRVPSRVGATPRPRRNFTSVVLTSSSSCKGRRLELWILLPNLPSYPYSADRFTWVHAMHTSLGRENLQGSNQCRTSASRFSQG